MANKMMEILPAELIQQVISHIPKSSLQQVRLVSKIFASLSFPRLFSHVTSWLDLEISHRAAISLAHDAYNRPTVMWSPWAVGPEEPVNEIWMTIVWKSLMKSDPPGLLALVPSPYSTQNKIQEQGIEGLKLTPQNFAELSGRKEMTENRLRTSQNRFLLHRAYTEGLIDYGTRVDRQIA
ncbi:hypothetical protein BGZ60DRAFT_103701 [Tricladium varicosporioides]|nr:hypothetical protein BGZ60DRAFT_103701 [Hymenoscyphus varicosporioides]